MLDKMQADFEQKQTSLMADHKADMAEKEKEYRKLIHQGLDRQAEQYKLIIDEMKRDREQMEKDRELQQKALDVYKEEQNKLMEEMRKQRELNAAEVAGLREQFADMRDKKKKKGGGCIVM